MVSFSLVSKKSLKILSLLAFVGLSLSFTGTVKPVCAGSVGPGCDATFMTAIKRKAWMEAQREIMIAQSIIAKPDSVFALGCFGKFYNEFEIKFSNGTEYDISSVVDDYVSSAFPHTYGGGHYSGSQTGTNTNCGIMAEIWNKARCVTSNMSLSAPQFGTLQEIASYDSGSFPTACSASGSWSTATKLFYDPHTANKSVGAGFDDMNLFGSVTRPFSETSACSAGIPTGVSISSGSSPVEEIVCANPGCASNGASPPKCCKATVSTGGGSASISFASCSS